MRPRGLRRVLEPGDLMPASGNLDKAAVVPGGVDPAALHGLTDRREVLAPQLEHAVDLVRPARQSVLEPVRERRLEEAAVAPARAPAAAIRLEQRQVLALLSRLQRRPQTGEAAAHHPQLAAPLAHEGRQRLGRPRRVEPEDARL